MLQLSLSRPRLPYHPLCTRGSRPLNIDSLTDSVSHHPHTWSWLSCHTCTSFTHTHISSTLPHTLCEVLICPGCHIWAFLPVFVFPGYYPCLVPRLCDSPLVAPTRIDFPGLWYLPPCPDHPACLSDDVSALPTLFPLLVINPVLFDHSNKRAANGSRSVWCFIIEDFAKQRSSSIEAVNDRTHCSSLATRCASTSAAAIHSAHRAACYSFARSAYNSTASRGQPTRLWTGPPRSGGPMVPPSQPSTRFSITSGRCLTIQLRERARVSCF